MELLIPLAILFTFNVYSAWKRDEAEWTNAVLEDRIHELKLTIARMDISESNLRDREKQLIERNKFLEYNNKICKK